MAHVVLRRLLLMIPVLFLVSLGTFLLIDLAPGDPAVHILGESSTPAEYLRVRTELGLDQPVVERYWSWLSSALQLDLGSSLVPPIEDVTTRLVRAFPVNIELAVLSLLMALVIAIPVAVMSAYRPGGRFDRTASLVAFGFISVPSFLLGIILLLVFAIYWPVLPTGQWARPWVDGWGKNLRHAFLPALTLALNEAAIFARLLRNDMVSTLQEDYILAARAKGMPVLHILMREALRPSSFSLITLAGVSVGRVLGGTIVVEVLFALPGVGRLVIDSATKSDYTLIQGAVLVIAVVYIVLNGAIDVLYSYLDPRIRRGRV